jgi:hypothetical protein
MEYSDAGRQIHMPGKIRNALIGLTMLATAAFGDYVSQRQTEVSAGFTKDSVSSSYLQVHKQHDENDLFLRVDNNDRLNLDGYLDYHKKHLLGEGSVFYEGRVDRKDSRDNGLTHILEGGHSILDFKNYKNGIGFGFVEFENKNYADGNGVTKDSSLNYWITKFDTVNNTKRDVIKMNNFNIWQSIFNFLRVSYENSNINVENNEVNNQKRELIRIRKTDSTETYSNSISHIPYEENKEIKKQKKNILINYFENKFEFINKTYDISNNADYPEYYTVIELDTTYLTKRFGSLNGETETNSFILGTKYNFIKNLFLLYSDGNGKGSYKYYNQVNLPDSVFGEITNKNNIKSLDFIMGSNFLLNLNLKQKENYYDMKLNEAFADTFLGGWSYQETHEDEKENSYSADFYLPFSNWGIDVLVDAITFRQTEKILDEQEDKMLRMNLPRRSYWQYSPYTKTKVHLNFTDSKSKPINEEHKTNKYEAGIKQCILNLNSLKLTPFYNFISSKTNSNYQDTLAIGAISNQTTNQSFGLEAIIKNNFLISITAENEKNRLIYKNIPEQNNSNWRYMIQLQKIFTPIKQEWFE